MKVKPIYHEYINWEDYKNGMYSSDHIPPLEYNQLLQKSKNLLKDKTKFLEVGLMVIDSWEIASEENLTKSSINKRAWIGQASCSLNHKATEKITKEAWFQLTEKEQYVANSIADKVIKEYERKSTELHKGLGIEML